MSVASLLLSWQLVLESDNRSPKTIKSYTASVRSLAKYLREQGMPDDIETIDAPQIREFLGSERERTSPAFAQQHYRNLHVFFRWIEAEGERSAPNPMAGVSKPQVPESVKPFFDQNELSKLLTACLGQDFEAR